MQTVIKPSVNQRELGFAGVFGSAPVLGGAKTPGQAMKVRDTVYLNSYGGPARAARTAAAVQTQLAEAVPPAAPAATVVPVDVATLMGIPEAELTPKVRAAIDRLMTEVHRLKDTLEQANKRVSFLETLADQDALTSLLNRRAFVRELSRMMAFAERYKAPSSVIYFDVNGMKQINDSLGHAAGDAALGHLGKVLLENVRASDVVGRLGGDEFAVLLAQVGREGGARQGAKPGRGHRGTAGRLERHVAAASGRLRGPCLRRRGAGRRGTACRRQGHVRAEERAGGVERLLTPVTARPVVYRVRR